MKAAVPFDPLKAVDHLCVQDAELAALINRIGPYRLKPHPTKNLFAALLRSIVYQQLNGKAATIILARVHTVLAPFGAPTPAAIGAVSDEQLRTAGLSRAKIAAARDLAAKCLDGTVPTWREAKKMEEEALLTRLTTVRGIGPWTVHMLMMFHLGRPDVMPTGDFAIRLAFKKLYRKRHDPTPETILKHARSWQPYRSVACWYLWRSLDPI